MQQAHTWKPDILGNGFTCKIIDQPHDYEGAVICTLVRKPARGQGPKAVLYVHGFNDYFFHSELAEQFNDAGYHFYALDLRKSGRSWLPHQKFNNVRDIREYFEDVEVALKQISAEGHTRIVLYGHSMGGLITSLFMAQTSNQLVCALVLNSPFFEMNKDMFTRKVLLPLVSRLAVFFPDKLVPGGFSRFYGPSLHKTEYGEWAYNLNWKPHVAPLVNMGWTRAIYKAQHCIREGIRLQVPALLMHPERSVYGSRWHTDFMKGDAILNVKTIIRHSKKIEGDCTLVAIKDAVHDVMLSSPGVRQKAYDALFNWLKLQSL